MGRAPSGTARSRGMTAAAMICALTTLAVVTGPAQAAPMSSDRSTLKVVADGVPVGRSAKITVAGKKFRKKLTTAGKLRNLRPGTYRVYAAPIAADGGTAAVQGLPVLVKVRTRKPAVLRLAYQWRPRSDTYPPSPGSDLRVAQRTTDSIRLQWTNGQAPDLQSVVVRRAEGAQAPPTMTDGESVPVAGLPQTLTDTNLRPHTAYSYSVFMVDAAGNASTPAQVGTRTAGRAQVLTAGTSHTCALLQSAQPDGAGGSVQCWGDNSRGQLGHGPGDDALEPYPVELSDVADVSAGAAHTCAVRESGDVWCWGANDHGQLGNGSSTDASVPVRVTIPPVRKVAAGGDHTCAVLTTGSVRCWGANDQGQAGAPGTADRLQPVTVSGLRGTVSLAAGHAHSCAIDDLGVLRCWGAGDHGQLGDGGDTDTSIPVRPALQDVEHVTAGVFHTCAVLADSSAACWGGNDYGQLGDATDTQRPRPVVVPGLKAASLSAGAYHTCAVLETAGTRCWGRNVTGRLGDTTALDRWQPVPVTGLPAASSVAAGGYHSCATTVSGARCWGHNADGQLGRGTTVSSLNQMPVEAL